MHVILPMTENDLDRRSFLRNATRGCALLFAAGSDFRFLGDSRTQDPLRIAVHPGRAEGVASGLRGVTLGVEEAGRAGQLMGRDVEVMLLDPARVAARAGMMPTAVVGGWDEADCREMSRLAETADILFMNVGCRSAGEWACGRNVFHVQASERMYAHALAAQGLAQAPEAVLWHPSLERYGAAQLNERFAARFGVGMDGPAWAGWMAVKAVWEASLRARTTEVAALRAWLEREGTHFDGHKGWPLSFRPADHRLRQPLYLAEPLPGGATRIVGEVPERRGEEEAPSRELLDRLGADPSAPACVYD